MSFTGEGVGKIRDELHKATIYTDQSGNEQRAPDKVAFVIGVACFAFIFVNAWAYYFLGVLLSDAQWSDVSGFYTYIAAFTGGTFVPFIVQGWRRARGDSQRSA